MKIRNPLVIKAIGFLGAGIIRAWMSTIRIDYEICDKELNPWNPKGPSGAGIGTFWHENILGPAFFFRNCRASVLISSHADGEMIARVITRLGFGLVRGSTTRGGVKAIRELVASGKLNHLAITPDGPRGPRRVCQQGIGMVSIMTGLPVYPIGIAYRSAWYARSWDRFGIPKPFSRCCVILGPAVRPDNYRLSQLELHTAEIQKAMETITARAEYWRIHGHFPSDTGETEISLAKAA